MFWEDETSGNRHGVCVIIRMRFDERPSLAGGV